MSTLFSSIVSTNQQHNNSTRRINTAWEWFTQNWMSSLRHETTFSHERKLLFIQWKKTYWNDSTPTIRCRMKLCSLMQWHWLNKPSWPTRLCLTTSSPHAVLPTSESIYVSSLLLSYFLRRPPTAFSSTKDWLGRRGGRRHGQVAEMEIFQTL